LGLRLLLWAHPNWLSDAASAHNKPIESDCTVMTRALRLQIARELRATKELSENLNRSPLFNLICNNITVGFSLLEFAEMLCQIGKPGADDARNAAEKVYGKSMVYAKELTASERTSAFFNLRRLRTALDEFGSEQGEK
jgi:hypothetical protein